MISVVVGLAVAAVMIYFIKGLTMASVVGCSPLVGLGWKEGVFVNHNAIVIYHKEQNYLPTWPKVISRFDSLHTSNLEMKQGLALLSSNDLARYENGYMGKYIRLMEDYK